MPLGIPRPARDGVDVQLLFQIVINPLNQISNKTRAVHADAPMTWQVDPLPDAITLQQFRIKCNFYYCI
ncbi:hypothetical protein D3C78_1628220 [compost metagenome]